jgi:hypothetical protein
MDIAALEILQKRHDAGTLCSKVLRLSENGTRPVELLYRSQSLLDEASCKQVVGFLESKGYDISIIYNQNVLRIDFHYKKVA